MRDFAVDGLYVVASAAVVEDSDYGGMGAVDGANDTSFGAAIGTHVGDFDQHEVSVHGVADEVRGDEDVSRELGLEGRA